MAQYAGLDVSNEETAIHILDESGRTVWRGKRASDPEALATILRRHAPELQKVGLETGPLTPWLYHTLKAQGFPIVCLDARHARAATALQRNKTDERDAETLAQLVRTGWYKEARVKGWAAHLVRSLVTARSQLVGISTDLSNQIRSTLKTFGLKAGKGAGKTFERNVRVLVTDRPAIASIVEPLLLAWLSIRQQLACLDRKLIATAREDAACQLLMTCPGVGVVVAATYAATIEAPGNFTSSRAVGAYLGLTPSRHQSGEVDRSGGISRRGDRLLRAYLFEAAATLLIRVKRPSMLASWGRALKVRVGFKRAAVALARKLAVVLHAMWRSGTPFQAVMA